MKLIITTFILLCWQIGAAQVLDSVLLHNGTCVIGKVLRFSRSGNVILLNNSGYTHSYKAKYIQQIVVHSLRHDKRMRKQTEADVPVKIDCEKPYAFRERGLYSITYVGTGNGIGHAGDMQLGLSLQQVAGFQLNRMLGVGVGVGLENFSVGDANGPLVLPVYAEARGYFLKKNSTPYYTLNIGYGFAFKDEDQRIIETQGGLLLHPALGFRLGAKNGANFLFDLGYKFQWMTLTRDFTQWTRDIQVQELLYKRFSVRLGLIF